VRVITGEVEHVNGPGGRILDDQALQERNAQLKRGQKKAARMQQGVPSPTWSPLENTELGISPPPVVRLDPSLPDRPPSRR
jgi:hypothetical protein